MACTMPCVHCALVVALGLWTGAAAEQYEADTFSKLEWMLYEDGADIDLVEDVVVKYTLFVPKASTVTLRTSTGATILGEGREQLLEVAGTIDIHGVNFEGGRSTLRCGGGAVHILPSGKVSATGCAFEANEAECGKGGAVFVAGSFRARHCSFSGNWVEGGLGQAVAVGAGGVFESIDSFYDVNGDGADIWDASNTAIVRCEARVPEPMEGECKGCVTAADNCHECKVALLDNDYEELCSASSTTSTRKVSDRTEKSSSSTTTMIGSSGTTTSITSKSSSERSGLRTTATTSSGEGQLTFGTTVSSVWAGVEEPAVSTSSARAGEEEQGGTISSGRSVQGTMSLAVASLAEFVADPAARVAVQRELSYLVGVPSIAVNVRLSLLAARRLQASAARGEVRVDYDIDVGDGSAADAAAALEQAPLDEVGSNIALDIFQLSGRTYDLAVTGVTATVGAPPAATPEPSQPTPQQTTPQPTTGGAIIAIAVGCALLVSSCAMIALCVLFWRFKLYRAGGIPAAGSADKTPSSVEPSALEKAAEPEPDWQREGRSQSSQQQAGSMAVNGLGEDGWSLEPLAKTDQVWNILPQLFRVRDARTLGFGRDVREAGKYSKIVPVAAWRLSHATRAALYKVHCDEVRHRMQRVKRTCSREHVQSFEGVQGALDDASEVFGLDGTINEKILLHGTTPERVLPIIQNGLNENMSAGFFGNGVYLAEDADKADQYCSADTPDASPNMLHTRLYSSWGAAHPGRVYYAFVCRSALGCPVFTKDGTTNSLDGTPVFSSDDQRELRGIPGINPPIHYHSLVVQSGPASQGYRVARHREFVIFRALAVVPELLVAYRRE